MLDRLGGREKLNFDEFFAIEKNVILEDLANHPNAEVDSTQVPPPSSFFCPYAREVVRNWSFDMLIKWIKKSKITKYCECIDVYAKNNSNICLPP